MFNPRKYWIKFWKFILKFQTFKNISFKLFYWRRLWTPCSLINWPYLTAKFMYKLANTFYANFELTFTILHSNFEEVSNLILFNWNHFKTFTLKTKINYEMDTWAIGLININIWIVATTKIRKGLNIVVIRIWWFYIWIFDIFSIR